MTDFPAPDPLGDDLDMPASPCARCGSCGSSGPILDDVLWKLITTLDERFLCRCCMEVRLGRSLRHLDLEPKIFINRFIASDLCDFMNKSWLKEYPASVLRRHWTLWAS